MFASLKNHPFAVDAFFKQSLVLTFALPINTLKPLLPTGLVLETYDEKWGFLAVALVNTRNLRPTGFPDFLGHSFTLIGYRLFVKYHKHNGRRLRGLYILKSETDKKIMKWLGNLLTHYRYANIDLKQTMDGNRLNFHSDKAEIDIVVDTFAENLTLPENSPFPDWKIARRYAGPLPFTFSAISGKNEMLIVEGVREHWQPRPVNVETCKIGFLDAFPKDEVLLASAFLVENIPYHWKKGKLEKWRS